jgi:hypothetical protein
MLYGITPIKNTTLGFGVATFTLSRTLPETTLGLMDNAIDLF